MNDYEDITKDTNILNSDMVLFFNIPEFEIPSTIKKHRFIDGSRFDRNTPSGGFYDLLPLDAIVLDVFHSFIHIITPTNSGSSFLKTVLQKSSKVMGYKEPESMKYFFSNGMIKYPGVTLHNIPNLFYTLDSKFLDTVNSDVVNNYEDILHFLYHTILSEHELSNPECLYNYEHFLDKNPLNLAIVKKINKVSPNSKFIFLVRNPYAIAYGLNRMHEAKKTNYKASSGEDLDLNWTWNMVGTHVNNMFKYQKDNVEGTPGLLVKYEDMVNSTTSVEQQIKTFLNIDDINLKEIQDSVKDGAYSTEIQDYNEFAISQLSDEVVAELKEIFTQSKELYDYFGYTL
jgi:hypothetical protein